MGHDYKTLIDCFDDFGEVKEFDLGGNLIKIQPAWDKPHVCCSTWQNMDYEFEREKKQIASSASIDDIFPSLAPEYRPQLFHYYVNEEDGRAAVGWRVPCVPGGPYLKSLMVALMMWNGMWTPKADPDHIWRMLAHGPNPNSMEGLDIFLWGYITDMEKSKLEAGETPKSLGLPGDFAVGFTGLHNDRNGIRIPFER